MKPSVSVICQVDGHAAAEAYADMVGTLGFPLVVNFPSKKGHTRVDSPSGLIQNHTGLVVLVVTMGWFRRPPNAPSFVVDPEVLQKLFNMGSGNGATRIFPVIVGEDVVGQIQRTWVGRMQWFRDGIETKNQLISLLEQLENAQKTDTTQNSFAGVRSTIESIETASDVELVEQVRNAQLNVAYDVYRCRHRIHSTVTAYVHLHRGINISATSEHYKKNHAEIASSDSTFLILNHERGQSKLGERVENIKRAFANKNVSYIEDIVSLQLRNILGAAEAETYKPASRTFLEPQVRSSIYGGTAVPGSDFERLTTWITGETAGVIVLEGQGGIGKTWTMNECRSRIVSGSIKFDRSMDRRVVFITSTDVTRPGSTLSDVRSELTLYDLFVASERMKADIGIRAPLLQRETFYNAIELGNIIVMVDGLDEIIARYRSQFDPDAFFSDIQSRMNGASNAKIIISCRKLFFDQSAFMATYPSVQSYELLAFDETRRAQYFQISLQGLPGKIAKAYKLSDQVARSEDGRFIPFVLSLIVDMMREEADSGHLTDFKDFTSEHLDVLDYNDRVVGQFCEREIRKIGNPLRSMPVDHQLAVLCELARALEDSRGRPDSKLLSSIISQVTQLKSVDEILDAFLAHPFIVTAEIDGFTLVALRFDFMNSYFLVQGVRLRWQAARPMDVLGIRVLNKYCTYGTFFCSELSKRMGDDEDFGIRLLELKETGERIIETEMPSVEKNILAVGSAAAEFSWAIVSLLCAYLQHVGKFDTSSVTRWIESIFAVDGEVTRLALLSGFTGEGFAVRLDVRGMKVTESLFHSIDVWEFHFDAQTEFQRCRFVNCYGHRRKDSGVTETTFHTSCVTDDVFQKAFSDGQDRVEDAQEKIKRDIINFVSDFYSSGRFVDYSEDFIEKHYVKGNPSVPFKRMFSLFIDGGVLVKNDRRLVKSRGRSWFMIAPQSREIVERLVTQGVLQGALRGIAIELR